MKIKLDDYKNSSGWVQRTDLPGGKGIWTVSGVLWSNIKERCTANGSTQRREPTYVGCLNLFNDFQEFADWHVQQRGYNLGYQLDADILSADIKTYSPNTCLLIPAALNKFLQTSQGRRGDWPQGLCFDKRNKKLYCNIGDKFLGRFKVEDLNVARGIFKEEKDALGRAWYERLAAGEFEVDGRVVEHMKNWEHICDWKPA